MNKGNLVIFLPVILIFLAFSGCDSGIGEDIEAQRGVLDLQNIDFNMDSPVSLKGEWEFYWNRLLSPGDFTGGERPQMTGYFHGPGFWNEQKDIKKIYPVFGCATFRMRVDHKAGIGLIGIYVKEIDTAYRLYIDDILLIQSGTIGTTAETHKPDILPRAEYFTPQRSGFTIILQISNFSDRHGGFTPIVMGRKIQIEQLRSRNLAMEMILFGSFLIMGLYHLALFFLRKKEKGPLFFGLFCLSLSLRTILMGERFLYTMFPGLYHFLLATEFLTVPAAAVCFSLYFHSLYPYTWYRYLNYVFMGISGLFSFSVVLLPVHVYSEIMPFYQLCIIAVGMAIIAGLLIGIAKKHKGALIFLIGFLIFFATAVNDILYYFNILKIGYFLSVGLFIFIFFQSVLLSLRFLEALTSVERLSEKLVSLDKLKDAFLANTSHELRTPLYGIIGLAESLYEGTSGKLNDTQARTISLIISSGRRLANLVNDILDFSKMKKKELVIQKKPVDLREVCDVVFVFSRPMVAQKDISLENNIPKDFPFVYGDETRLQQIMHNLIGNSIKFTESGRITVSAEQRGSEAFITVTDTGIGIPPDKLDRIFESFEQVDTSLSRPYGGTGIGLSITKQLIELQGGAITVDSVVGRGSSFTFSIPISKVQQREEDEIKASRFVDMSEYEGDLIPVEDTETLVLTAKAIKVLIVDDEQVNHEVIKTQLDPDQFELVHVLSGKDALKRLQEDTFDIVLLDVMMPGMSGYLVCKKIREKFEKHQLPIIIFTVKNLVSDLVEGLSAGANDYISKPVHKSELIARIKTHVQLAKINIAYSRFVPNGFLRLLGRDSIVEVERGDQIQRDMTIMFCDIRSFMSLSESMSPKQNFNFLNSYFEKMGPSIRKYNGYIDKYIGDGIMAIFPGNPEDALKAALEMKKMVATYNTFRVKSKYSPIQIGIGIHNGPIMLGTIGDEYRIEGTVISDSVNVAARLEALTKAYGGSIIISSSIFFSLQDPSIYFYRFLGHVQVKGKRDSVPIYEIFDNSESGQIKQKTKDFFEKGLLAYLSRDFVLAEKYFDSVLDIDSYDRAARLYRDRAREYAETGVPEDWEGQEKIDIK
ncbi:MAG: response regulator [Spirochaetales bacterium]|nr:response regulator [Spirochaetales bacterium]